MRISSHWLIRGRNGPGSLGCIIQGCIHDECELFICSFCNADYSTCAHLTFPHAGVLAICYYFFNSFLKKSMLLIFLKGYGGISSSTTSRRLCCSRMLSALPRDVCSFSVFNQRNLQNNKGKKEFSLKIQLKLINKPHGSESDKNLFVEHFISLWLHPYWYIWHRSLLAGAIISFQDKNGLKQIIPILEDLFMSIKSNILIICLN